MCDKLLMGEYYAYARNNFRVDPNINLPKDDLWDETAKKYATFILFLFYNIQCLNIEKKLPIFY